MYFDNYMESYIHHHSIIQNYSIILKIPERLLGTQTTTTLNPWQQTDLFAIPIILPFPEFLTNGIIQYQHLEVWLLSLSKMHLRSTHVGA